MRWSEVDFDAATVQISSTVIRIKGEASSAMSAPRACLSILGRRDTAVSVHDGRASRPATLPSITGGFARPGERRELREARETEAHA